MLPYPVIFWDLDGTLLDTLADLTASLNFTLAAFGFPPRTATEVRRFLGNGAARLIQEAAPAGTDPARQAELLACFRQHYNAHCQEQTRPYPGVPELVRALGERGAVQAVLSNKPDMAVGQLVRGFFGDAFALALGDRPGIPKKPAPDPILFAAEQLRLSLDRAIYVGDSEVDLATARNAGLPCLSVTWGFREEAFLRQQGAVHLARSAAEAGAFLGAV